MISLYTIPTMPKKITLTEKEQRIEKKYHISWYIVAYKFLFGFIEFLFGIGITLYGRIALGWYRTFAATELAEDPHDLLVRFTEGVVPNILMHHTFLAIYLIALGLAKIAGAVGLMYKQHWGVDLLVALTFLMFPFQFIRLLMHPSLPDFLYIGIGIFIALYLIEFRPHEWAKRVTSKIR